MIDCHAHLIARDVDRYPPAPVTGPLRPVEPVDPLTATELIAALDANGVERALVVQRSQVYGFDNSYVCDAAAAFPRRLAAVCSIDGRDPQCGRHVRHWIRDRGAVGIRMMEPSPGADLSWFAVETARQAWREASELCVPVCVHFFRWNRMAGLEALAGLLRDFPDTSVVIDHFSNMTAQAGPPDFGLDAVFRAVADFPRVHTKFTTIPLGQLAAAGIDAAPIVHRVIDVFGPQRVMWGSDIAQSKGTYAQMTALAFSAVRLLPASQRQMVLHDTAASLYSLHAGDPAP